MKAWQCGMCGYSYKQELGDPINGAPAGTTWGELPEDWVCPECGASKDDFTEIDL